MKFRQLARGCLSLVIAAACGWPVLANDWSSWRGPEQNGLSRETNLPENFDPFSGENVAWKNDKVTGMSSPVVVKGKLYTWTRVGEVVYGEGENKTVVVGPHTQEALVCVDVTTGKTLWEYRVNMSQTDVPFHRLGWGNVVADPKGDRVYGYGVQGHLVCLDTATGKPIWYHQMLEEYGQISTFGGRTESPTIDEDQLLITGVAFGWGDNAQGQHRCFAFDKATGEMRWTSNTGGRPVDAPYGTPIITVVKGERLVCFCAGDGGVYGFKARTGEKVFWYQLSKRGTNSTPLIIGDKLIACSSEENPDNGVNGRIACLDLSAIDASNQTIKEAWHVDKIEAGFPSPTTDGKDTVFVMDNSSRVHALDLKSGKKLWEQKVGTVGKASLVFGDGKLYACDAKNFVVIQPPEAGKKKAKVLSRVELGADAQQLGREYFIFGSPAIADGRIYLQTAAGTYCIGPKEIKPQNVEVPALAKEEPADKNAAPAVVQVVPCDRVARPGEQASFAVRTYDAMGRLLGDHVKADWSIGKVMIPPPPQAPGTPPPAAPPQPTPAGNLKGNVDGDGQYTAENGPPQGGAIVASVDVGGKKLTGMARVRVMPNLPWSFDFESALVGKPPLTWLNAGGKFAVMEMKDKNKVLVKTLNLDLYHAARTFFGDTHRTDYTIEADVQVGSKMIGNRAMPDAGVIANKYGLTLMGNQQTLMINSWSGALPKEGQAGAALFTSMPYAWEPDKWYHLKLSVKRNNNNGADICGKVWAKGESEPEKWALQIVDTEPNPEGSPGLFGESLVTPIKSEIYYDNILVSPNK
jgi:outer membrane protein assembly factor BamB